MKYNLRISNATKIVVHGNVYSQHVIGKSQELTSRTGFSYHRSSHAEEDHRARSLPGTAHGPGSSIIRPAAARKASPLRSRTDGTWGRNITAATS